MYDLHYVIIPYMMYGDIDFGGGGVYQPKIYTAHYQLSLHMCRIHLYVPKVFQINDISIFLQVLMAHT